MSSDASPQQIHEAFRSLIGVHRDRLGEPDPARIALARRIAIAHAILRNPVKRQQYDDFIAGSAGSGATLLQASQSAFPKDDLESLGSGDENEEPVRSQSRSSFQLAAAIVALGAIAMALVTFYPPLNVDRLPASIAWRRPE